MSKSRVDPCMGLLMSRTFRRVLFFFAPVSLFDWVAVSSPRPVQPSRPRAQELSRLAVAPCLRHARALLGHVLTASSAMAGSVRSGRQSEGSLLQAQINRATTLYSVGPEDPNHDAAMRIGREAPKRRTHSTSRH